MATAVIAGAHLGYDLERIPMGGGGAVGTALIARWAQEGAFDLVVLGSGPTPPVAGVRYVRVDWEVPGEPDVPSALSVRGYASFCVQFSRGVMGYLRRLAGEVDPATVCVVHNDVSEGPDFAAIRALGYRQIGILHVDVVDYVSHIYLRGAVRAPRLARAYRGLRRIGAHRFLPLIARLIFEKQEGCVRHCDIIVVPSRGMAEVLERSYPSARGKVRVVPWGTLGEPPPAGETAPDIRSRYGIDPHTPVLVTLSRISPEKGQDLLLRALRIWERRGGGKLVAFICGAPAFMHGRRYLAALSRLARGLRRVEVRFPGYVAGAEKRAYFRAADLYVFPSRHESYGLTLAEAMAAGLPVLTTDHRSARDLVRPDFGMVVEPTPRAIQRGLAALLSDRARLREM
ncbi:MAG: glycosyltransferase family 4 protein, partial [Caldiserica bacterium]|nr:glycosyltransferase family 4 protein [Caldisericota bacterium]